MVPSSKDVFLLLCNCVSPFFFHFLIMLLPVCILLSIPKFAILKQRQHVFFLALLRPADSVVFSACWWAFSREWKWSSHTPRQLRSMTILCQLIPAMHRLFTPLGCSARLKMISAVRWVGGTACRSDWRRIAWERLGKGWFGIQSTNSSKLPTSKLPTKANQFPLVTFLPLWFSVCLSSLSFSLFWFPVLLFLFHSLL